MQEQTGEVLTVAEQIEMEFIRLYDQFDVANAPEKKKADVIDSFWNDIYKIVFKPRKDDQIFNNCKSRLKTWDVIEVQDVVEMYIKLCKRYGGVIKINQFANLTGIHPSTLWLWNNNNNTSSYIFNLNSNAVTEEENSILYINNTDNGVVVYRGNNRYMSKDNTKILSSLRFDIIKKLREEMQDSNTNGLSNDTMGHAIRANNEDELGKLYEPKRMLQQATVRQALTDAALPRLGAICSSDTDNYVNNHVPEIEEVKNVRF